MANKDIFCAVPWYNSHLYWDGTYGACCSEISKPTGPVENIQNTNLITWYNSAAMRNFRLRILGNEKLPECQRCYIEEQHGHESRRIRENFKVAIFTKQAFDKSFQQSPWNKKFSESAAIGTTDCLPIDLHIDFGNECNLACKMCSPDASSKIAQSYKKWGISYAKKNNWTNSDILYKKLLKNIQSIPKLHRIHIMGGEPLVNKRFYEFVDWLVSNGYSDLSLSFVSNGTIIDEELIKKMQFFKSVDIEISLESIYNNNHYIRQGVDTKKTLQNIDTLLKYRTTTFNIVLRSVPQLLNVNNYDQYILFALRNKISIQSIPLSDPEYLAIKVLPMDIRMSLVKKYIKLKEEILQSTSDMKTLTIGRDVSRLEQQLVKECDTVITMLEQPESNNIDKLRKELIFWLMRWDKLFKLNALDFYPEYSNFFKNYGYSV